MKIVDHKIIFPSTWGKFQDFRFFRGLDSTIKLHQMNDKKQTAGHKLTAIIPCCVSSVSVGFSVILLHSPFLQDWSGKYFEFLKRLIFFF